MTQDEEMDMTPLTQTQPLFFVDKEKTGKESSDERRGDDSDSEQDEDPDFKEIIEVSVTKKASNKEAENGKANRNHSESEESSEEDDTENEEEDQTVQVKKKLPVFSPPQHRTLSWRDLKHPGFHLQTVWAAGDQEIRWKQVLL